jgi:4-hydroxyphenylacetate 3-monooxygenase
VVAELPDDPDEVVLDDAVATMDVDGTAYQRGTLVGLRMFGELWSGAVAAVAPGDEDLAMFGGTLPLLTGTFVPGRRWHLRLALPAGPELEHEYEIERSRS